MEQGCKFSDFSLITTLTPMIIILTISSLEQLSRDFKRRCADDVTGAGSHIDQLGISENLSFKGKIMSISNLNSILITTDYS